MELTPGLVGSSLVVMVVIYIIAFAFQVYVLYLNWKQSKVNDQMSELILEVKAIKSELSKMNKPSSKKK